MVWKEIKGYEGRYMVSDTGKIMSLQEQSKRQEATERFPKKEFSSAAS